MNTNSLNIEFIDTLENAARFLNVEQFNWMVFGGAAMALYGIDDGPVKDIDIVVSAPTAAILCERFSWYNHADDQSPRFRSDYLLRPCFGSIPVEILGGFRIESAGDWIALNPADQIEMNVGSQEVFLPSPNRLSEIFYLCGREKDIRRAAMLRNL